MARARSARLKVFRTPIGFHDAYVAAPSRKAALEAWGAGSDLFAAGAAELVEDAALAAVPLSRPGEVIKVLRGTKAEQVAALGKAAAGKRGKGGSRRAPGTAAKPRPRPSAAAVEAAEAALEALARAQAREAAAIAAELRSVERRRRELERRHQRELAKAEQAAARAQERFDRAMAAWRAG